MVSIASLASYNAIDILLELLVQGPAAPDDLPQM